MSPSTGTARPPATRLDVDALVLRGRGLAGDVRRNVTDMTLEQALDGASTLVLTINDSTRTLLHSPMLAGSVTVVFDGISWTAVKMEKDGSTITLTFEETAVFLLRQATGAKKADRDHSTRAQFIRSLVNEVHPAVPFRCPEVNVKQPVAPFKQN
jgi:hypothetical protein